MSTDDFPVVEATLEPAEVGALRKAHVYFKASRTDAWYFVETEPGEESRLQAVLPRPLASALCSVQTGRFGHVVPRRQDHGEL